MGGGDGCEGRVECIITRTNYLRKLFIQLAREIYICQEKVRETLRNTSGCGNHGYRRKYAVVLWINETKKEF